MDLPGVARAVLIALFVGTGLYCLARCAVRPSGSPGHEQHGRVADLAQVASSTAMIAMLVTGYTGDWWGIQLTVFAAGTGWFLVRALPVARRDAGVGLLRHAVMMAAMFWMSWSMPPRASASLSGAGTTMSAMAMSDTTRVLHPPLLAPSAVTTLVFAGLLVAGAVWWTRQTRTLAGVYGSGHGQIATRGVFGAAGVAICHAVAGSAMSAALLLLVW